MWIMCRLMMRCFGDVVTVQVRCNVAVVGLYEE